MNFKREGAITVILPKDNHQLPPVGVEDWTTLFSISDQLLPEISLSKVIRMSLYSNESGTNDIHFFDGGMGMFINRGITG